MLGRLWTSTRQKVRIRLKDIIKQPLTDRYYSIQSDILAYNAFWCFVVVGGRNTGKTYGALKYMYENKQKFIFIKRTNDEVKLICSKGAKSGMKADISPFQGYNVKNAPFYGGTLSPMWMKEDNSLNTSEVYISHNGDKYYVTGNQFYKNDTQIGTISQTGFHEEIINGDYYDYYDDNFWVKKTSPTTYQLHIDMGDNDVVDIDVTAPTTEELKTVLLKENSTRVYCAMIGKNYYCYRKGSEAVPEPLTSATGQFTFDSSGLHNVIVHNNYVIFQN